MTWMLASVTDAREAAVALAAGVDLIDLKDPARGALGALDHRVLRAIVAQVDGKVPVSATIGDLPMRPSSVEQAAMETAATGVDFVKLGLFKGGDSLGCIGALADLARQVRLVAVFLADQSPDFGLLAALAAAGFRGAMLDTADKCSGGLRAQLPTQELKRFVAEARPRGLMTGLAGSLRARDVAPLLVLNPDLLGFRGALCTGGERTAGIDARAVADIRRRIPREASRVHALHSPHPDPPPGGDPHSLPRARGFPHSDPPPRGRWASVPSPLVAKG